MAIFGGSEGHSRVGQGSFEGLSEPSAEPLPTL